MGQSGVSTIFLPWSVGWSPSEMMPIKKNLPFPFDLVA